MTAAPAPTSDPTFRNYTPLQATSYLNSRPSYSPALYNLILNHHSSTGGKFDLLVDVGCGPGNATRDLAGSFEDAVGVDAGEAMIAAAREKGGKAKSGRGIGWVVGSGEEFAGAVGEGKADLLTVATAVHWFDMDKFWAECAKVLKPGGTVAIWTRGQATVHPSTPNSPSLLASAQKLRAALTPYELLPNRLSRNLYDDLPLPWSIPHPVPSFPESSFVRKEFDRDGVLSNGTDFFGGSREIGLEQVEKVLETASMVTRWKEANPELAGTERDVLKVYIKEAKDVVGEEGTLLSGSAVVVLLFKKV